MQTIKTMWKAIFQNKLTIYKANLPSFVQKIIKSRCYVDLSRRIRLKCHPKMAAWERLIDQYGAIVELLLIRNINHVYDNRGLSLSYAIFGGTVCRPTEGGPRIFLWGPSHFFGRYISVFQAKYFCFWAEFRNLVWKNLGKVPRKT
jgi:hypothetical protein